MMSWRASLADVFNQKKKKKELELCFSVRRKTEVSFEMKRLLLIKQIHGL